MPIGKMTSIHPKTLEQLASAYLLAKESVIRRGFSDEIDWQYDRDIRDVDVPTFLAEYAWVVLSCGMRERTVRSVFGGIVTAFQKWSLDAILAESVEQCMRDAMKLFANPAKIGAIGNVVSALADGAINIDDIVFSDAPLLELQRLPFVGPVTVYHLAKNLGMNVCKPDRHLVRLARTLQFATVDELCNTIALSLDEKLSVVDIVLWRYLSFTGDYSLGLTDGRIY
jgi:hypothetical protein